MTSPSRTEAEVKPEEPQLFPLEKILTVSARNYCDSVGRRLSDYEMIGVHAEYRQNEREPENSFVHLVPRETERVVDYQISGDTYNKVSGTALIPKSKQELPDVDVLPDTGGPVRFG